MPQEKQRESLGSRLGFIFLSAGCAIGLGNVWRFPYITGKHGGAAFVLLYLFFLFFLAMPIMVMEFSVGRASRQSVVKSFSTLQPRSGWTLFGLIALAGNYLLMMFYTTVAGWMLAYTWNSGKGALSGLTPDGVNDFFGNFVSSPENMIFWMLLTVLAGSAVCAIGLRNGVERITKFMMSGLLIIMLVLVARSVTLPGGEAGLAFYLLPDFARLQESGIWNSVYAALGQAFFTLSIGIGSMAIFGSYIKRDRTLTGEAMVVTGLDTFVALMAGLIIFPVCFASGVDVGAGPGLVFMTLPNLFNSMYMGRLWSTLFFLFMSFAAMTTVVAVFEHLIANLMDLFHWSRRRASLTTCIMVAVLSLPCALGFNLLSDFAPFGEGSVILDLEDFIVSNNMLPLGALCYLLFCCTRWGWGWNGFIAEADAGNGVKFPQILRPYITYVVPLIVLLVFAFGYLDKFPALKEALLSIINQPFG